MPDGSSFSPEYLSEVAECVKRNNLDVTKIYGMHISLTDWKDVEQSIDVTRK